MRNLYLLILLSLTLGCITTITPDASIAVNDTAFSHAKLDTFQEKEKRQELSVPGARPQYGWFDTTNQAGE